MRKPKITAIGGVLRDWKSNIRCLFSIQVEAKEINEAEVLAILFATELSFEKEWMQHLNLVIESDSSNAVEWSNMEKGGSWKLNFALNRIREWKEWLPKLQRGGVRIL